MTGNEVIIGAPDPHLRLRLWKAGSGFFQYAVERWSKYYTPSSEDIGPVEGGLWGGDESGLYLTYAEAEQAGLAALSEVS